MLESLELSLAKIFITNIKIFGNFLAEISWHYLITINLLYAISTSENHLRTAKFCRKIGGCLISEIPEDSCCKFPEICRGQISRHHHIIILQIILEPAPENATKPQTQKLKYPSSPHLI